MSSTSNTNSTVSTAVRMDYSKYVADITGSPKAARHSAATGIGHHINPLHNPYPSRPSQATQQQQQQQQPGGMPQYGGGAEKCARCAKTVYQAEKKVGAGRPFHISCFSCHTCHRKLDSTVLSEHKGEIYCKSCYTKQFGAHGLISGVTMSTEQSTSRRSSYGNDLDTVGAADRYSRQRTNSRENLVYDDGHATENNRSPIKQSTQHTDRSPEKSASSSSPLKSSDGVAAAVNTQYQRTSSRESHDGINAVVNTPYQRAPSPSRGTGTTNDTHRSTYIEEDDRSKYVFTGEKLAYGNSASAVVNVPVISQTKQPNVSTGVYEIPIERIGSYQRSGSRSSSIASNDSYRRQSSRERQTDFADDYSRLNLNEDNYKINRTYSNDHTMNALPAQNPLTARTYQSSSSSSHETRYSNTNATSHSPNHEQYHSRESSPAPGHVSSSTKRTTTLYQSTISPVKTYTSPYEHHNNETPSNANSFVNRSPSPISKDRPASGLMDFVSKTNLAGNTPSTTAGPTSALGALASGFRPFSHSNADHN